MGSSTWSDDAYKTLKKTYATQSTQQIFSSTKTDPAMNPNGLVFRECRDSDVNPQALAIMFFLDETGSMGRIPENLVRHKLGTMIETIIAHGVPNPAVLFAVLGDNYCDHDPLQVGQFESGTVELNNWLTKAYLEGNGGGNGGESYGLAWLIGARHTSIDCFEKRGQKGFLFTCGDENIHPQIPADALKKIMGYTEANDIDVKSLLEEAKRTYHVFHLHITEQSNDSRVISNWKDLLGESLIMVDDSNAVAEIVASTVAVMHGADLKAITATFDPKIANSVTNALVHIHSDLGKPVTPIINL